MKQNNKPKMPKKFCVRQEGIFLEVG